MSSGKRQTRLKYIQLSVMGNDKEFQIVYKVPSPVKQHNGLPETIHLEQVCKRQAINDIAILLCDSIKKYRYRLKFIKKSSITRQ